MPRTKSPDSTTQNGAGGDRRSARIKLRKAERAESSGSRRTSNWIDGKSNKKEKEPPVMRLNAREHLGILKKNLITLEQEIQDMKEEYERKLIDLEERADTIRDEIVDVNSFIALAKDQGNYLEILNVDTKELVSAAPLPPPPPVEPETVNFLAERKVKKPEKKQGRKQRKKKRSRANQEDITESEVDEQEVDRRLDGIKEELKGLPSFIQLVDNKDVKGLEALLKYIQSGMRIIKNGGKTCTNCGADMYVFHGHKPGFVKWMCSKYRKKLGCPSYLKRVGPNHWTMDLPQQKKQKKNKNRDPDHVPDQVSKSKSASKSEAQ